jgi:uncharacterized membrane protein YeaQ/YmgE (transglycosylase-associated protein family)
MFLALLCWVAVGFFAGVVATKLVNLQGDDPRLGFIVGALAAVVGGFVFRLYTHTSYAGPGLWSLVVAAIAAAAALAGWHMLRSSSRT